MQTVRNDLHQRITQQIIQAIEAGAGDYRMPWNTRGSSASLPQNPVGKYEYHGINVLSLWASQQLRAFTTGRWASYRQWMSIGAQVRKGETGSPTVFYQPIMGDDDPESSVDSISAQGRSGRPFIMKMATVFNADQVDGFQPEHVAPPAEERLDMAEQAIKNSKARILWGGEKACYLPTRDEIHLPHPKEFATSEAYYGIAFHELVHWTGHASRCARDLSGRFGTATYAMEELIAELGAAFVLAEIGLDEEPRIDHARYLSSWLTVLKNDTTAVFTAATNASRAARYLLGKTQFAKF